MAVQKRTSCSRSTELEHWDRLGPGTLGYSAAMLEILFEPQNTEELYRIRGNWVHVQLGQIIGKKMQKDQEKKEKPSCHFWMAGRKTRSKSKVLCMPPELNTTKGMGKPP